MTTNTNNSRVAIVTAASRGIGAACARELARRGYSLALMSRSAEIWSIAKELGAVAMQGSVTEPGDLKKVVDLTLTTFGRVDAVVNNSGNPVGGELLDIEDPQWEQVIQMYLMSVIRMSRIVTPLLIAQGGGSVVNISGSDAYEPDLRFPIASTVRSAIGAFQKLYATRYAANRIRMNSVLPGVVLDYDPNNIREDLQREIPMQRPASHSEIANAVAFLLSDDASYITGQNLIVDGGATKAFRHFD